MIPIYQELYFVYESLKTKVDQNSMVTSREIWNGMFMLELCFIPVIRNKGEFNHFLRKVAHVD